MGREGTDEHGVRPALQVIVLGSGGGPLESNVTGLLVRSLASGWSKGSIVAVDAGVHLSAIKDILYRTQPKELAALPHSLETGPFAGLKLPFASASANAAHIHRTLIDTYLITHPHLDHISGFVINTAGLARPKRLAGLPSTISAFKNHIFNNVIWPNLSDENNGAGLVTYMRLVEGGSPALGDGDGRGYLEISDGLAVKTWGVSHGHCIEKHAHRGSGSGTRWNSLDAAALAHHNAANPTLSTFLQHHHSQQQIRDAQGSPQQGPSVVGLPGSSAPSGGAGESVCVYDSSAYFVRDTATGREVLIFGDVEPDSVSLSPRNIHIWQEAAPKIASGRLVAIFLECSHDDSVTLDRLFGHLAPRFIAEEMAALAAEVRAARQVTMESAAQSRNGSSNSERKRMREVDGIVITTQKTAGDASAQPTITCATSSDPTSDPVLTRTAPDDAVSPKTIRPPQARGTGSGVLIPPSNVDFSPNHGDTPLLATPTAELNLEREEQARRGKDRIDIDMKGNGITPVTPVKEPGSGGRKLTMVSPPGHHHHDSDALPLRGLKVVIIHVKDKLNDTEPVGDIVMRELQEYEREARLGVEYVLSSAGEDFPL